jgi:hypothetical protein
MNTSLPKLPGSWSELSWQQLCDCWQVKQRYGGHADVARAAALLQLLGLKVERRKAAMFDLATGEPLYQLRDKEGRRWKVTPREMSQTAASALPWFDYPYGDPGEPAVKDDKGKVTKEGRDPVRGYVSGMRDALILPRDTMKVGRKVFALPQVACNNLTWQQYRSLQAIAPQLFSEGLSDTQVTELQAQFLAHCLVPRSLALLDTTNGSIRLRPHYEFVYNATHAEGLVKFWKRHTDGTLFHICFQCYQTALTYYAATYPLLFSGDEKKDAMRDALSGEVGTINTIMKYAGYAEQQQVYDSNLPFVLDILNTMTKEAKEIERMNARIKKK